MKRTVKNLIDHARNSEKETEAYLVRRIERRGWFCLKYSNPNMTGFPDRLIVMDGGRCAWCEVKSKGKRPGIMQELRHEELRRLLHRVFVIDSRQGADRMIETLEREEEAESEITDFPTYNLYHE